MMKGQRKPDFSGWATKFGIKCTDGRTILKGAFSKDNGKKVPIVYQHIHDDPDMILGHAILYERPEGMWTEGYFNNNPKAERIKECLRNEDIEGLSIYANDLKHVNGQNVVHGNIKELSVVLAGANMGATIQNVMLAHGDGHYDELEDEAIIYNDDMPIFGETLAHADKKKDEEEDGPEESEGEGENGEEPDRPEEDSGDDEEGEEGEEDEKKKTLRHEDAGEGGDETLEDILNTMNDAQQEAVDYLVGVASGEEEPDSAKAAKAKAAYESMNEKQKDLCHYLVGAAEEGEDGEGEDEEGEGDTAAHSGIDDDEEYEEETTMKKNAFERTRKPVPADILSHDDMKAIIQRGIKLGSMRHAWEEALETNETLSHSVYNDDGSEQTYGVANLDYLFPDYTELYDTPEMIQRDQDWVNVILNGVKKSPKARLRTTFANITMDEARAKGYAKGDKKDAEVFSLLRRTVDPQTIYKYQELDQDDFIDLDDFNVIAWMKAEMRLMLNEEIARAILIGDGRDVLDKYKIKEDHIKPIVNDADLFAVKVTVTAGADDAATAKNGIRQMIKDRKFYKGSGNLIFFTGEDFLSECLLLEDGFGHDLYADAAALAKKLRVQKIVTCPFLDDLTVDGQKVLGIAVDLNDYITGTNRRGEIKFFDDFDIEFNKNQFLIETRLSGMLRKPFSAMIMKVGTQSKGAPHYDEETPVGSENPRSEGWYEKEGDIYRRSTDTSVNSKKTYYSRSTTVNPQ